MGSINNLKTRIAAAVVKRLGETVTVSGTQYQAKVVDDEFYDEQAGGFRQEMTLTVTAADAALFSVGDSVIAGNASYTIEHIPNNNDALKVIELKRA